MHLLHFLGLLALLFSPLAIADEWTHQLGNSGYAIREAMQKGAPTKCPERYRQALVLQNQAKEAFKSRARQRSMDLSRKAEIEARALLKTCTQ